jgi:CRP/FNR family transcriptional regulator
MTDTWLDLFPSLEPLDEAARRQVLQSTRTVAFKAGDVVFREGNACRNYVLVLEGRIRVQKVTEGGREIVLYRIGPGESCVLTTSCLLGAEHYPAEAVAETEVRAVLIPLQAFQAGLAQSSGFRNFVFTSYGERLAELILLIQEVAFGRVDVRLARFLGSEAGAGGVVHCTHQELAVNLATAREVVSRQLKEFERRGWVRLRRGSVEILRRDELEALVANNPV